MTAPSKVCIHILPFNFEGLKSNFKMNWTAPLCRIFQAEECLLCASYVCYCTHFVNLQNKIQFVSSFRPGIFKSRLCTFVYSVWDDGLVDNKPTLLSINSLHKNCALKLVYLIHINHNFHGVNKLGLTELLCKTLAYGSTFYTPILNHFEKIIS